MKYIVTILLALFLSSSLLISKDKLSAEEYQILGFKYRDLDPKKAKEYFEKSCNLNDSLGCAFFANYLNSQQKINISKKAIRLYKPSVINKDYLASLYVGLGRAYRENQNQKEGCIYLKKACELGLCNPYNTLCLRKNRNMEAQNALQMACIIGDLELVKKFIKQADVNGIASDGWTPLLRASKNNYLEIVKYLINHGADLNVKNSAGYTALHKASYSGHGDVVKYLISKGAEIDIKDAEGKTPLLISVDFYQIDHLRTTETIELLLKNGANPKIKDNSGLSTLDMINLGLRQKNHYSKELYKLFKKYGF